MFDLVGGEVLARSPALLKPGGALVSVVSLELPASRDDIRTVFFIQEASRAQLTELARLVDEGHLRPQVGGVYPLAQAARRTARRPPAASPAGSSSSPDPDQRLERRLRRLAPGSGQAAHARSAHDPVVTAAGLSFIALGA